MGIESTYDFIITFVAFMAGLFIFCIGLGFLVVAILFVVDITQTKQAIRHNYPVIGRLRYIFEELGVFFRQYFFASEREEKPFNRAQRSWVYRAGKNIENTIPFGTTRDFSPLGAAIFVNSPFPLLEKDAAPNNPVTIGPHCKYPYLAKRIFNISGMSFGAISKPAVLALSNGARMAGCWMNTGEGGLSQWHLDGGADLVFQIGTAKYGVRNKEGELDDSKLVEVAAHEQVRMFEIKLSQGAKPGKGGILPGIKVMDEIASIRGIPVGQDSISPNRHTEISNVEHLIDLIERVRGVTGKPTGFKAVVGTSAWLDDLFEEIKRRGLECAPDFIAVDSADGGSAAAPMTLADYVGLLLQESLPLVIDKLIEHGLRDRVKVIASGKLILPGDVVWALCMGADFVVSARGFMFALGCIQSMKCHTNTCPTGITTHNPRLQRGLDPQEKAIRVKNYVENMTDGIEMVAHSCGVSGPRRLNRRHCRIRMPDGRSAPLDDLYPDSRCREHSQ